MPEILHVYLEMQTALKVINTYKKGRLKSFKNYSDAVAYAKTGYKQCSCNHSTTTAMIQEQSNNFRAPKTQEFIAFKRLIEDGDLEAVKNIVWENPRYLISSADTPAILQMGYRYNALHIAAKNDKPEICEFILNTVGDSKFMQLYYGEDKCKTYLNFAQMMQNFYLNTPDKGLNETPLHFAVKFGFKDVVRVLVSYSQCIKISPNKYNLLPVDIICSRKCQENETLKREIRMLLEDQFYVPVLRAEGNACPATIGEPFSPTSPLNLNRDPISPRIEVRAFAGPMTKTQAVEFRKKWKTPPRITPKKGQSDIFNIMNSPGITLRLQDTEKGLEYRNLITNANISTYDEDKSTNCQQISKEINASNDIQYLCDKFVCMRSLTAELDNIDGDTDSSEFFTPPSSPELIRDNFDDDMQNAEEGPPMFIEESFPTKLDYAVYNALSSVICSETYPYIYRWRHDMRLAMKRDPYRFNNKNSLRRKLFTNK
ncbi:hypothetical protein P5V15_001221 [Pogonomyrmex californicus]